jgi:GDPmannose 4,6-dehydratase
MWRMLQRPKPDDFVIATGRTHTVREFCEQAFGLLDLDYRDFVGVDPAYYRPTEVDHLRGDASKARRLLKWRPKVDFKTLVRLMVESDLELARRESLRGTA